MKGIEYLELTADGIMPEMFRDFSWYADSRDQACADAACGLLRRTLESGGAVICAYISEEEDPGGTDENDDFVAVEDEEQPEEPEPYDWYIEDEEEPPCRAAVGYCAVGAGQPRAGLLPDTAYSELSALWVSSPYRRRGIGKGLCRRAARAARTLDAQRLYVEPLAGGDATAFFAAMDFEPLPAVGDALKPVPMDKGLYPRNDNGLISLEEYQNMAGKILDTLPAEFFNKLNGGVVVRPESKIHEQSVPGVPMYIMGEYTRSAMLGRMIYLYYGSFVAAGYGYMPRDDQRRKLRGIIVHEFRHHMEWLSGTRELEDEDERGLRAYLLRFAKKKDGRKKKPDGKK